ncbi:MAG TPA: hypothetical protein VI636_25775 [Candidatus Angelobacter sp.]
MRRVFFCCLLLAVAVLAAQAFRRGDKGVSIRSNNDSLSDDCNDHLQVYGRQYTSVLRDEETRTLPNQPLNLIAEHNGGIHISTWDNPNFSVKLCKQVAGDSNEQGRRILQETRLSINGDTISVSSPERDDNTSLGTLLLVKAPRDAKVSMRVENGGISVRHFTGTADAKAVNGGISLKDSSGILKVRAQNGGISIKDCSGDVTADVENGGLSLSLPEHWDGKGLEAHTENGGLVVGIPRNFNSGLEISGSEYVSMICKGDVCENGQRTWDNGHRMFRLGAGSPQIRATTVNGGIIIQNSDRHSTDM